MTWYRMSPLSTTPVIRDKTRQPTGRQGMPSPWMRVPFFHERGPPPGVDKSLQERLDELYKQNSHLGDRVDIGFASDNNKSRYLCSRTFLRVFVSHERG